MRLRVEVNTMKLLSIAILTLTVLTAPHLYASGPPGIDDPDINELERTPKWWEWKPFDFWIVADTRYRTGNNKSRDDAGFHSFDIDAKMRWLSDRGSLDALGIAPSFGMFRDWSTINGRVGDRVGLTAGFGLWTPLASKAPYTNIPIVQRVRAFEGSLRAHLGYMRAKDLSDRFRDEGVRVGVEVKASVLILEARLGAATEFYGRGRFDEFEFGFGFLRPVSPLGVSFTFQYQHGLGFNMKGIMFGIDVNF